ncbi:unnamed protein product [marine sediment metagenome]|uniref:Uncharacterized protein n=1 Tax=marine sediment metagenome TaxID=412755 RepID=X1E925_9ZZZZ
MDVVLGVTAVARRAAAVVVGLGARARAAVVVGRVVMTLPGIIDAEYFATSSIVKS